VQDILDRLSSLSNKQKLLLLGGVIGAILAFYFFLVFPDLQDERQALITKRQGLEDRLKTLRKIEEDIATFKKKHDDLQERLSLQLKLLPNEKEIPELLRRVSNLGEKIGLKFKKFKKLPDVKKDFYAEVPFEMVIEGNYHDLAIFFDGIGKMARIITVGDVKLGAPAEQNGLVSLTANTTGRTYYFLQ